MHMRRSTPLAFALFSLSLKEAAGHTCTFASTVHNSCLKVWGGSAFGNVGSADVLPLEPSYRVPGPFIILFSWVRSGADIQPSFFFLGLGSWPTHHNTPQSLYVMSRSGHKMPGVARVSRKVQTFTQCAFSHSWFFFSLSFCGPTFAFSSTSSVCVRVCGSFS